MVLKNQNETEKLFNSLISKDISPGYIKAKGWNEAGPEKIAVYFSSIQNQFQTIGKIIQFVSGSLILYQCQQRIKVEVFHPLKLAEELFEETSDEVKSLAVHAALKPHFHLLTQCLYWIGLVFKEMDIAQQMIYLTKNQVQYILACLDKAVSLLREASTFELGLNMVAIESSCAGHSH